LLLSFIEIAQAVHEISW